MMQLHEFLTSKRTLLVSLCQEKVAKRFGPVEAANSIDHGVPLFLEQLVETLRDEENTTARSVDSEPAPTAIGRAAALHGAELLRRGFSADQVVHDYGDVCQCVTALATWKQRLDEFSAEHRRPIDIAIQSLNAIKTGNIGISGATGALLAHTLQELRSLADRNLVDILLPSATVKAV